MAPFVERHPLRFYRYRAARPGLRCGFNRYPGVKIGWYIVVGAYAYCVKWGWARGVGT